MASIQSTQQELCRVRAGAIAPDAALLLSSVIYCGCLIAACLMEPSRLRSIVAFSAAATLLYTPLFKRVTAIKNATVATVIALAPLAGALAAGAVSASCRLRTCWGHVDKAVFSRLFVCLCVLYACQRVGLTGPGHNSPLRALDL